MKASSSTSTPRSTRERFTPEQVNRLEEVYAQTNAPTSLMKEKLAKDLRTTKRRIQVWYQNRRSKSKRQKALQLAAASAAVVAVDDLPPPPISTSLGPSYHQGPSIENASSDPPTILNAYSMTETSPPFIHTRFTHWEAAVQAVFCQPTYPIDAAAAARHNYDRHYHQRYYTPSLYDPHEPEPVQYPPIIRALPPLPGTQHQPSFRSLPQPVMPPLYVHEGSSFFDNRQNHPHPATCVSIIPNPGPLYLLSHETQPTFQQSRYPPYQQHRYHHYHYQGESPQVSSSWSGKKST